MTDKVQKIRKEVEKLHGNPYYMMAVKDVLEILDMQEEPVSEDLEEACEQLAENARKYKAETSSPFFSQTDYKQGVMDGAKWQFERVNEALLSEVLPCFIHGGEADEVVAKLDEVLNKKNK
jgi:hypothetical protein